MTVFKSKRPANCKTCGNDVPVGGGWTEGPPWVTTCQACSGKRENAAPTVDVTLGARGIVFKLQSFLGGEGFNKFRTAIEGASFDPVDRANYATVDKAIKMLPALAAAGFVVNVSVPAADAVRAKTTQFKRDVSNAQARASKVDLELQSRGLALFPFQKHGVSWLASRDFAFLADDMGLGKSVQMLTALPEDAAVIVLGPAVAKGVWQREVAKWRPDLRVTILEGKNCFRFPEKGELVVLTYNVFSIPEGLKPLSGTVLIADEAHLIKNKTSARGARFREACEVLRQAGGKVWLASATPMMNRPSELWSLFSAAGLAKEAFGSWGQFVRLFNGTQDTWGGWHWGTPEPEIADRIRRVSLRRMKVDVLDQLPPKTYREVKVDLDAKSRKALSKAEKVIAKYTRFSRVLGDPSPTEELAALREEEQSALREIFGDSAQNIDQAVRLVKEVGRAGFEELARARAALATAKIPAMLEVIEGYEAQEEALVVFSDHRAPIDFLAGREGWAVITGDTPAEERTRIQDDFQAGRLKGVAGTIQAAGVAITLTRASNALFVDLNWTPSLNLQAEDRIFRIGQTRGVLITTLVANHPVDDRLFELLAYKSRLVELSVDASKVQADVPAIEVVEVDFAEVSRAAEEERRKDVDAERMAADRRKDFEGRGAEIEKRNSEKAKERQTQTRREAREFRWTREAEGSSPRHQARSEQEVWTAEKLKLLSDLDPDHASERNFAGFSASDGPIGHKFAFLAAHTGLTEQQWALAILLCRKYRRQVGDPPQSGI